MLPSKLRPAASLLAAISLVSCAGTVAQSGPVCSSAPASTVESAPEPARTNVDNDPAGAMLEDFAYGWEVKRFRFSSQRKALQMAYLDESPTEGGNGRVAVLLHGKNFCAGTWERTMKELLRAGYRVVAPDQIGFCKSSKPEGYQYGLHTLAANTHELLQSIDARAPIVIGHSMGGMLALRYGLQYPESTGGIVLINPIGLEDWRAKGVPNATVDALFEAEKKTTRESIKAYQQSTYYAGTWEPRYDRWVDMLTSMYGGPAGEIVAWHQALTSDMIFNQPVVHELSNLQVPTHLFIGELDNTALGKARASVEVKKTLGNYAKLAQEIAKAIPGAGLTTYSDLGHSPHIQAPERLHPDLLAVLREMTARN